MVRFPSFSPPSLPTPLLPRPTWFLRLPVDNGKRHRFYISAGSTNQVRWKPRVPLHERERERDTVSPRVREISLKLLILWILIRLRGGTAWISQTRNLRNTSPVRGADYRWNARVNYKASFNFFSGPRSSLHSTLILLWRASHIIYTLDFDWLRRKILT